MGQGSNTSDRFYPPIAAGLLYKLGMEAGLYDGWGMVADALGISTSQLSAARGQKEDRNIRWPNTVDRDTYFNALGNAYKAWGKDRLVALTTTKRYLDDQGLCVIGIDKLFVEVDNAEFAKRNDLEQVDVWCSELMGYLKTSFESEQPKERGDAPAAVPSPEAAPAPAAPPEAAPVPVSVEPAPVRPAPAAPAPTLLRRLKGELYGADGRAPLLAGRPLSDDEFVRRVFPQDFAPVLRRRFSGAPGDLVDAAPDDGFAWDCTEFFASKQGVPFARMVSCCAQLCDGADAPAFYERIAALFSQMECEGGRGGGNAGSLHGACVRYADGSMARALAFMVLVCVVGPDKPLAVLNVVEQPEARKACKR